MCFNKFFVWEKNSEIINGFYGGCEHTEQLYIWLNVERRDAYKGAGGLAPNGVQGQSSSSGAEAESVSGVICRISA